MSEHCDADVQHHLTPRDATRVGFRLAPFARFAFR